MSKRIYIMVWLLATALATYAQYTDTIRAVRYTHLFGFGSVNLLDTYLSPLEYKGQHFSTLHTTYRTLRPGSRWTLSSRYGGDVAQATSPTDDGKYWDANFYAAAALRRKMKHKRGSALNIEGGFMGETFLGGTYSTRGGNNPAQGRLGAQIGLSGEASYTFYLWHKPWRAVAALDVPLLGVCFSPRYGQSYYEIFELRQDDHNIRCTYLGNAPSALFTAMIEIPLGKTALAVGYQADVRQSHLSYLKRHSWQNRFVIGWTRRIHILP